ncbi:MAG: hypothetical protein IKJ41_02160 [Clostridia bacterium]|nr:hypothetical protein [Clostridia bacterium]
MNFDFLKNYPEMNTLYTYCSESERFVYSYPDISITSARKSMEYIVKLVYGSAVQSDITGLTVFDMLRDYDFIDYLDNKPLVDAIHFIRKIGNQCVHGTSFESESSIEVLERLHFVAGTVCVLLGVINSFEEFDRNMLTQTTDTTTNISDAEPEVSEQLIGKFAHRLSSVRRVSELKKEIIDVHKNTKTMNKNIRTGKVSSGTDSGNNTRTAFQLVAEWLDDRDEILEIAVDNIRCIISAKINGKVINVAVKSGCPALAFKKADDTWDALGGIDYVLYATDFKSNIPVLDQLRVFKSDEFYKMWEDLGLIRKKVSRGESDRLKAIYGDDFKTDINLHADSITVQCFTNSNKKYTALQNVIVNYPILTENGFKKIF